MIIRYFSQGLMSLKEGMTLMTNTYDDDGELIAGVPEPEKMLFKCKEITKEEYDNYMRMFADPSVPKGFTGGILNEKGKEAYDKFLTDMATRRAEEKEKRINYVVKKISKLLALGVIEESDIEEEIKVNNALDIAEEIKRRLQEG